MNTKSAKVVLEKAGYSFVKNPCGFGWVCRDDSNGSTVASHNELGTLIQQVADLLGI